MYNKINIPPISSTLPLKIIALSAYEKKPIIPTDKNKVIMNEHRRAQNIILYPPALCFRFSKFSITIGKHVNIQNKLSEKPNKKRKSKPFKLLKSPFKINPITNAVVNPALDRIQINMTFFSLSDKSDIPCDSDKCHIKSIKNEPSMNLSVKKESTVGSAIKTTEKIDNVIKKLFIVNFFVFIIQTQTKPTLSRTYFAFSSAAVLLKYSTHCRMSGTEFSQLYSYSIEKTPLKFWRASSARIAFISALPVPQGTQ
jgi:hypothetical protein